MMRLRTVLVLLLSLYIVSCKKEATQWNSSWSVPLIKDTLTFENWIDSGYVSVNADQSLQLTYSNALFSFDINQYVTIPDTTVVQTFAIPVPSIFASPGANFVNDIDEFTFDLDGVELKQIVISSGKAQIEIKNPLDIPAIFSISLPGVEKDGIVFQKTETVPAQQNGVDGALNFSLDFSGYTLDLKGEQGNSFNKLQSIMQVSSSADGPSTQITNADVFTFTFSLKDIQLDYARGYFGNLLLEDIENLDVALLNTISSGNIDLENVQLSIVLKNGIKASGQVKINEVTSSNTNQSSTLSLTNSDIGVIKNINPATGSWSSLVPSSTTYNFSSTNSNIEAFIQNLGSIYTLDYSVELNPLGNTSGGYDEIFSSSKLALNLEAVMPLKIGVDNLVFSDTSAFSLNQDGNQIKIVDGEIVVEVKNSFPFSGELRLELLDENDAVLTTLVADDKITEAYSSAATITPVPLVSSSLNYTISSTQIRLLNQTKKIKYTVILDAANSDNQTIYADAQLIIDLYTNLNVQTHL
ncbi:MAG: hypothetical protein ACPGU5_07345 [Lishizhenia sp.]